MKPGNSKDPLLDELRAIATDLRDNRGDPRIETLRAELRSAVAEGLAEADAGLAEADAGPPKPQR